jgi:hypothetical protein
VRFCATLKGTGVNIFRASAVQKAINCAEEALEMGKSALYGVSSIFKEHLGTIWGQLRNIFTPFAYSYGFELKIAE